MLNIVDINTHPLSVMSQGFSKLKPPVSLSLELLLIVGIAIAILLRLLNLGSREFWYDEVLSLLLSNGQKINYETPGNLPVVLADWAPVLRLPAEKSFGDAIATIVKLLRGLVGGEPHPPLFFLSQHLWLRLFGNGEAAMRSLGALLSIGSIGAAYGLGRTLLGHRGGLLLAALLAANPFYLFHSLNIRMYGPLVLWTILSAWALLQLIRGHEKDAKIADEELAPSVSPLLWNLVLIGSVAAGLMTFYLFAYWLIALAVLVLYLDRRRWWQHGLRLGMGVLLTTPWALWGTRQQLRNSDFERFNTTQSPLEAGLKHLENVASTLGTHLVVGDWVTSLPPVVTMIAGVVAIALLTACSINLWRRGERRRLTIALILGIFPLLLALAIDIITRKFTLGFGFGRTMILILPGCLLLLAVWIEQASGRWKELAACALLLWYLSVSVGDFTLRPRWIFHQLADLIQKQPTTPTLVVMNSLAWGHVLRLAYYLPTTAPVELLAQHPAELDTTLEKFLQGADGAKFPRLIWLDSANPVWGRLKTDAEKETERGQVQKVLDAKFKLIDRQQLSGTMSLDQFTVNLYTRSSAK